MCQQTRIATVIEYFNRWMLKWPTVAALASADLQTVHEMWSGLGYYRRAQNLHKAAQEIVSRFNGAVPSVSQRESSISTKQRFAFRTKIRFISLQTVAELLSLPGIGPYTAGAIASTAFGVSTPLVDGNVTRVVSRLRAIAATPKDSSKLIWKLCGGFFLIFWLPCLFLLISNSNVFTNFCRFSTDRSTELFQSRPHGAWRDDLHGKVTEVQSMSIERDLLGVPTQHKSDDV